jgi:tetratricopeptide (TPR) repeat protein
MMAAMASDRIEKLRRMLQNEPNDPFLLYSMAMEHRKLNQPAEALQHLERVLQIDPGYCYAYYQRGQIHESMDDPEAAKQAYRDGIAAAERVNDAHARSELAAALDMIA